MCTRPVLLETALYSLLPRDYYQSTHWLVSDYNLLFEPNTKDNRQEYPIIVNVFLTTTHTAVSKVLSNYSTCLGSHSYFYTSHSLRAKSDGYWDVYE